jgi:hypothetical protein
MLLFWMLLMDLLIQYSEGFSSQPPTPSSSKSTTTANAAKTKSESTTPRAAASFALMESMAKRNSKQQKPKIAIRQLEQNSAFMAMDTRDRAFARMLLSTTERRMGQIDRVLQKFVHKPFSEVGTNQQKERNTRQQIGTIS